MLQQRIAKIHSFESFGTVDGPGIRFVIFFSGCPLRCIYCHNIDVVLDKNVPTYTVNEVYERIMKEKEYFISSGGGVTVSGGDPVLHVPFIVELFTKLKMHKIHTAFDTSLMTTKEHIDWLLPVTDLFLVSIKGIDDHLHKTITGVSNRIIHQNMLYLQTKTDHIWFRYLLLPGYTDGEKEIHDLIQFLRPLRYELLELLPYHTLGVSKWKEQKLPYRLEHVLPPSQQHVMHIKKKLEQAGITVKCEYEMV
jgi:pyruvate formate lyase activating enzyme